MNIYNEEEIERIRKVRETNERLEEFFESKRKEWNDTIIPVFKVLSLDMTNPINSKQLLEAQSLALSHRQNINEQISLFLTKRSKEITKIKKLRQDKFIFYSTGFGIKTNLGEKGILIDGHLSENDRTTELIESYIEFLRDTTKNLETFGYSIKNMIELMNILGKL
jgi:hypothetical protein